MMLRGASRVCLLLAVLATFTANSQTISTVAGSGSYGFSGDNGAATSGSIDTAYAVVADAQGNIFIADTRNQRVRKISNGTITTVAGNGQEGFSGDGGPGPSAQLSFPRGLALDGQGNLYISDSGNCRIRKLSANGTISTIAGTGIPGFAGDDGLATGAQLSYPHGLAMDSSGNLYVADSWNYVIRKITPAGTIQTVAGNGSCGPFGDGGPASAASLGVIDGLALDTQGNLYLSDPYQHTIREVNAGGTISTVAGGGFGPASDGGPASAATLAYPKGLAVDDQNNLLVADSLNHRVRKVVPGSFIDTLAGSGAPGYSGDGGEATAAQLNSPYSVGMDPRGSLYISDLWNYRVRAVPLGSPACNCAATNAASYRADGVAPGGIVALWGSSLASGTASAGSGFPLPKSVGGTSVAINGIPAPLFFVSPGQVNAQVPFEVAPGNALAEVSSPAGVILIPMKIQTAGPGIFTINGQGTGDAAILDAVTFRQIAAADPALAGEWIQLYGTGLGAVNPAATSGAVPPSPPPQTNTPVQALIDSAPLDAAWAGLAPGWVGLYAVNVQLPANLAPGSHQLQLSMGGAVSNTATFSSR
ncbi:MAG: hypothetical protein ACLQGV_14380 [Bryobacteraceae bacterium]